MRKSTIAKILLAVLLTPICTVLLAAVLLYLPPFQQWAVDKACAYASEETGLDVGIESVHLAFPLDLSLEGVHCMQQNDSLPQVTDTIAKIGKAVVDVELMPLFDNDVHINAIELCQVQMNTADFVHQCRVKGYVGRLMIDNNCPPVASVALNSSVAQVNSVVLDNAHLNIELADTVPQDTTKSETLWKIYVRDLAISNSSVVLHMPGDTLQIGVNLKAAKAKGGYFDLQKGWYDVYQLDIAKSGFTFDNNFEPHAPNGFDANHISLSNIALRADSIHYFAPDTLIKRASEISCLIRQASLKEKSGITLKSLRAAVNIDSTALKLAGALATPASSMAIDFSMQPNAVDSLDLDNGRIDAKIDASIGRQDLMTFAFVDMPAAFRKAWPLHPLAIKGEVHGNMRKVNIPWLTATLPTAFSLDAKGNAQGFMALADNVFSRKFSARLHGDMRTYNMAFVKSLLDRSTAKMINIPSVHAIADLTANGPDYDIALKASESKGSVNAKAHVNAAAMNYVASAKVNGLNLGHFVKGYGLSTFTGSVKANGQGTDILAKSTKLDVKAGVQRFHYAGYDLGNMKADVALRKGRLDILIDAHNKLLDGQIAMNGIVSARKTDITVSTEINNIDLYALKAAQTPLTASLCGHLDIATDMQDYYKLQGMVSDIAFVDSNKVFHPDDIVVDILTRKDTTMAKVDCGDFAFDLHAQRGYRYLMGCGNRMMSTLKKHFEERTINQDDIRRNLPRMTMTLHSGKENPIARMAKHFGVEFSLIDVNMRTSRESGIFADMTLNGLTSQGYKLDSITANITSTSDPKEIYYNAHIENRPPNDIVFDAYFDGKVLTHGIELNTKLYDNKDKLALQLGVEATMEEKGIKMHLTPKHPVLGYEQFTLNDSNYVFLAKTNKIHANIDLLASNGTGAKIYCTDYNTDTDEQDSTFVDNYLQDLTLSINKLDLGKITASLPYAPKIEGMLNGDYHVMQNQDKSLIMSSDMTVSNMTYEGCGIGNIGTQFTYLPKDDGSHYIDGLITLNDKEVGMLTGSYNTATEAIDATMKLEKFPMEIVNGFIPQQLLGLEGTAEGSLAIKGTTTMPDVNGELYLQDAALLSVPYGVRMRFDDDPVTIKNSRLLLENFQMYAPNDEPLITYGYVDFSNTDHIKLDMKMRATDFQLINAKETSRSEAYGKVYVNCAAMLKGELSNLQMQGKLEVLPSTNLYYILRDSPITTDNTMKELVSFTDLSDTTNVKVVKPQVNGMNMAMNVVVDEGAHIKCWIDGAHNNYLDLIGNGDLRLTYRNEEIGMTGRYTISEGEMKYSLPVIPLKTFTIDDGSYLEWTGEMMNPHLNITAKETMKASVNIDNVNQMVTFKTGVRLSKTLSDMGLEFLIEAPENKTVADELSMLSNESRGKLAVTMLTTGMYMSDGNMQKFSMNSALSSFLQSQINTIAGSALRTVDLSFGMESSTEQDGTRHNDYTFKFAKRFWNNRLAISVGGKISSGPEVSGQNKSFFNNVDLQYRLTETSNKYLQMFYKKDVYDYLEGYLSQYGGGFLWKKKAQTFMDIFHNTSKTTLPTLPTDSIKK